MINDVLASLHEHNFNNIGIYICGDNIHVYGKRNGHTKDICLKTFLASEEGLEDAIAFSVELTEYIYFKDCSDD